MKYIIKFMIATLCAFIFSAPVFAQDYEHTINYMQFQGYKESGISVSVTTNIDTDEGTILYVAIYSEEGNLCEAVSMPLEKNSEDERHVYRLNILSTLDETMTVKAFIWKDMLPCALPLSIKYDDSYNSGELITAPSTKDDLTISNPINIKTEDDIINNATDISSHVITCPISTSTGNIEATEIGSGGGDLYQGIYPERTAIGKISIDEYGKLISNQDQLVEAP